MEVTKQKDIYRLVLGTAQLGMVYGIANKTGQPACDVGRSIIHEAWKSGIQEFDTAQSYGESERVLGRIFKDLNIADKARVVTKLNSDFDHSNVTLLGKAIESSINNLGVESLYGLMLHREEMLDLWEKGLGKFFKSIVDSGLVRSIGVSVYSPERAIQALNTEGISMVQLPTNIIDRRFEKARVFELADDIGKTIYIRSIFLQGLLLMSPEILPNKMRSVTPILNNLAALGEDTGLTVMELCIGYIKNTFPSAMIVIGVETPEQVRMNLKCWGIAWSSELTERIQMEFKKVDEIILNPSLW